MYLYRGKGIEAYYPRDSSRPGPQSIFNGCQWLMNLHFKQESIKELGKVELENFTMDRKSVLHIMIHKKELIQCCNNHASQYQKDIRLLHIFCNFHSLLIKLVNQLGVSYWHPKTSETSSVQNSRKLLSSSII